MTFRVAVLVGSVAPGIPGSPTPRVQKQHSSSSMVYDSHTHVFYLYHDIII